MKSNLDSLFKTDFKSEKEGVWFNVGEGTRFLLRRFGGSNSQKVKIAMAKYHKPKARLIELDQLPIEETDLIMAKVFTEACLVDWEKVEIDGKEVPCSFDNAVKLFTELPELFRALYDYAQTHESYKEELGNS
jgi:hypothetical protein